MTDRATSSRERGNCGGATSIKLKDFEFSAMSPAVAKVPSPPGLRRMRPFSCSNLSPRLKLVTLFDRAIVRSLRQFAELLGSSQSRVAKIEAGDPSVSLDLLTRSMLALGASKKDVARALAR